MIYPNNNSGTHPLHELGSTGIQISKIGLGTVKFGRNQGVKYPSAFELPSDETILRLLKVAQELGINVLDTAPAYGTSEERLGSLFGKSAAESRSAPSPINRKDWVIVTKVGEEFLNGQSTHNFSPKQAEFSVIRSLERLNTDYLDVVLVHSDGNDIRIIEESGIFDCLSKLKSKGMIRAFGMSTKTIEGGILAAEQSDVVMVTYNILQPQEKPVIDRAYELKKGVLIKKALASGHIDQIPGDNPVRDALSFVLKEPGVSSIILGTLNIAHLRDFAPFIF